MAIERIYTRAVSGGAQHEHRRVRVVAGAGIEGDRYFGRGDYPGQNVTLVEAEEIEAFLREFGRPLDLSVTGRNLVTRGVRLNALVGKDFVIGTVRFRGAQLCEPCRSLGRALESADLAAAAIVRRWTHRAGLNADALTGGEVALGCRVELAG
jgi:MOSC domain-containing protein YiiM